MTAIPAVDELTARIDAELKKILAARDMMLYHMISYQLGGMGEGGSPGDTVGRPRNHGIACLLACNATGGDPDVALPAAVAVELMGNYCQVHDDIQEGCGWRDGRDTVWRVWGTAQAINAGDGLHSMARLTLFRLRERGLASEATSRAVRLLDEASLVACEGRSEELEARERLDTGVEDHLRSAVNKSGSLYSCAMRTGVVAASADDGAVEALGACGAALGVAVQVRDEVHDFWSHTGDCVPSKWKPLPVVMALDMAGREDKKRLSGIFLKPVFEPGDKAVVQEVVERSGARESCTKLIHHYQEQAKKILDAPGISTDGAAAISSYMDTLLEI